MPRRKEFKFFRRTYESELGFFPEGGFMFLRYKKVKGKPNVVMPTFKELKIRRRK